MPQPSFLGTTLTSLGGVPNFKALVFAIIICLLILVHVQNFGGVASRVLWEWRDSYGKTGNFGRVGDKSMFKMYRKLG